MAPHVAWLFFLGLDPGSRTSTVYNIRHSLGTPQEDSPPEYRVDASPIRWKMPFLFSDESAGKPAATAGCASVGSVGVIPALSHTSRRQLCTCSKAVSVFGQASALGPKSSLDVHIGIGRVPSRGLTMTSVPFAQHSIEDGAFYPLVRLRVQGWPGYSDTVPSYRPMCPRRATGSLPHGTTPASVIPIANQ